MSTAVCPHCGAPIELIASRRPPSHADPPRSGPPSRGQPPRDPPRERQPWEKPPQPWTLERAGAFVMPFGKHRNKSIAQIWQVDRGYLEWGSKNLDRCRNAQKAAQVYLASKSAAAGTVQTCSGPSGDEQFDALDSSKQPSPAGGTEFNEFNTGEQAS
jgi:hypothetical protein